MAEMQSLHLDELRLIRTQQLSSFNTLRTSIEADFDLVIAGQTALLTSLSVMTNLLEEISFRLALLSGGVATLASVNLGETVSLEDL